VRNFRVLIAEDSELNRLFLENLVTSFGYDHEFVTNGKEAIDLLRKEDFDLVLMDIEMPVLNGIEALHVIRKDFLPPKSHIPIVAITAHTSRTYCLELLKNGFDHYLMKPYKKLEIQELLEFYSKDTGRQMFKSRYVSNESTSENERFYDLDYLKEIAEDDEDFMNEMMKIFVNEIPSNLSSAKKLASNSEWETLGKLLHKIAPAYAFFGIHEIESEIHRIEEYIHLSKDLEEIPKYLEIISELTQKVINQLRDDFNV
jgi:CheY-like chemotaxis protein/HPt (histidine-containing phosphotransfer) domain-containing protein